MLIYYGGFFCVIILSGTKSRFMTLKKKILTRYMAAAACIAAGFFMPVAGQEGTYAYTFLTTTSSAHAYGLGGTNISIIDDDINLYEQNPALLGPEVGMQLGFSYMRYLGGSNFAGVRFGKEAGENAAWAAGVQYFGYGEMTRADATGTVMGTFHPQDIAFSGMYSHDFNEYFRGGIAMKLLYSSYESYTALAIAADLGVNYYNYERDLSLSFVLKNVGGQVKRFAGHYDRLPWDIQIGYTQSVNGGPFRISVTGVSLNKWKLPYYKREDSNNPESPVILEENFFGNFFRHLIFAVEYAPSDKFYVGVGYNHRTKTDMATYARSFLSGFSAGAGFKASKFRVGVAFAQPHIGGTTLMVNLSTNLYEFIK